MGVKQIFGNNLHSYRKLRSLSQEQLAEKLDISVKHLSTLETGKVFASAELIEKISKELNVSISALFYTPDEKSFDESDLSKIEILNDGNSWVEYNTNGSSINFSILKKDYLKEYNFSMENNIFIFKSLLYILCKCKDVFTGYC